MTTLALHPIRIANFRAYFIARLAMTVAQAAMAIIIGWQVYDSARAAGFSIREGAFLLGMIGVAQFLPLFLLTPFVGLVADNYDRRWIARGSVALLAVVAAALWALNGPEGPGLVALYSAAVLVGVARAFSAPAFSALAPNLVPRESLPTAIAVGSIAWQAGVIIGPGVGGVLYAINSDLGYVGSFALFALSLAAMLLIGRVPQPAAIRDRRPLTRIADGFRYVRQNRLVFATISLDLFAVLLASTTALLPVFARDILKVGPDGLGLLAAGMGMGALATALVFSVRPMQRNVGDRMLMAVIIFGVATIVFGLSRNYWLSLAALVVAGGADMVSVYIRQSLIQLSTPDAMRGRVGSVSALTISASNELGEAESGLLAALIGPVGAVLFGGVGAIAITLAWARLFPELRLAKSFDPPETDSHPSPSK